MKVKRLKELLSNLDDDLEIFIRNSHNICGTIGDLDQVEKGFYSFFGSGIPCVILNTSHSKELECTEDEYGDEIIIDYIETDEHGNRIEK